MMKARIIALILFSLSVAGLAADGRHAAIGLNIGGVRSFESTLQNQKGLSFACEIYTTPLLEDWQENRFGARLRLMLIDKKRSLAPFLVFQQVLTRSNNGQLFLEPSAGLSVVMGNQQTSSFINLIVRPTVEFGLTYIHKTFKGHGLTTSLRYSLNPIKAYSREPFRSVLLINLGFILKNK